MTEDQRRLLKNGLWIAMVLAGFWWSVSAIHKPAANLVAFLVWWVVFFAIFYRASHKKTPPES